MDSRHPVEIAWNIIPGQSFLCRERSPQNFARKLTMTDRKYLEEEYERHVEVLSDLNDGFGVPNDSQAKELAAVRESGRICRKCDQYFPSKNRLQSHIRSTHAIECHSGC